jgi:hypothetical protein
LVSKRFFNVKTKTEARREAILAAAKAVFEEMGFEQATMSEITARVGGSKATLYRYFDSKEALDNWPTSLASGRAPRSARVCRPTQWKCWPCWTPNRMSKFR